MIRSAATLAPPPPGNGHRDVVPAGTEVVETRLSGVGAHCMGTDVVDGLWSVSDRDVDFDRGAVKLPSDDEAAASVAGHLDAGDYCGRVAAHSRVRGYQSFQWTISSTGRRRAGLKSVPIV